MAANHGTSDRMTKRTASLPRLELVVLDGPDEGLRLMLEPPGPHPIGRSGKGLSLADPLVNIWHAEIRAEGDRWLLRDLGSAKGTRVGDVALEANVDHPLEVGQLLTIGETRVRVERPTVRLTRFIVALAIIVLAMGLTSLFAIADVETRSVERALTWHEPIRQGAVRDARLQISAPFLRQHGIDPSKLQLKSVTDHDADGIDEIWLAHGDEQIAVTFGADGSWRELGRFPQSCMAGSRTGDNLRAGGFPSQRCPGRSYEYIDGAYRVAHQEGAVVWVRESVEAAEGMPAATRSSRIVPHTVAVRRVEHLAGFLAQRGVSEPVAWLMCETALPELRAQVRTARGELLPLGFGCHSDIRLDGQVTGEVVAVAFTAAGREALLDDLRVFLTGSPDALFASAAERTTLATWAREPGFIKGGTRVLFEGTEQFFQPIASEGSLPSNPAPLFTTAQNQPAPPALTATLLTSGTAHLDPPGCVRLELTTDAWSCNIRSACMSSSTFLTVREVGCGSPRTLLRVPYSGGTFDTAIEGVQIRASVDTHAIGDGVDVWRARVGYRVGGGSPAR